MMQITIPTSAELATVTEHRNDASISIYLESSPRSHDTVRLALKNATDDVLAQLKAIGIDARDRQTVGNWLQNLQNDAQFWMHQANTLAIFVSPETHFVFKLVNTIDSLVAVGDRFDAGPLLRAVTFPNGGYVLTVTEGPVKLYEVFADHSPVEIALRDLPDDLHTVLQQPNTDGRFDRHRADGTTGPRIERQRYCTLVQEAVLKQIGGSRKPLMLAASNDLEPAYRAVNTYDRLLEKGLDAHPNSLTLADIDARARVLLDEFYAEALSSWREHFGSRAADRHATHDLAAVAKAASASGIDELHFDIGSSQEGTIDEFGAITPVAEPGPTTYRIVDEIAARVLRSGGVVRAVRADDMPNSSPVAAILRYQLPE